MFRDDRRVAFPTPDISKSCGVFKDPRVEKKINHQVIGTVVMDSPAARIISF